MSFATDVFVALVLITSPEADLSAPPELAPAKAAVQAVADALELADASESWLFDYDCGLADLRGRYRDLKDAPLIEEGYWLPPAAVCWDAAHLAAAHAEYCQSQTVWHVTHAAAWRLRAEDHARRAGVWRQAADAASSYYSLSCQRHALAQLRDLLGEVDFDAGRLPAPLVPLGVFR